jgi:hypothetical protein
MNQCEPGVFPRSVERRFYDFVVPDLEELLVEVRNHGSVWKDEEEMGVHANIF